MCEITNLIDTLLAVMEDASSGADPALHTDVVVSYAITLVKPKAYSPGSPSMYMHPTVSKFQNFSNRYV